MAEPRLTQLPFQRPPLSLVYPDNIDSMAEPEIENKPVVGPTPSSNAEIQQAETAPEVPTATSSEREAGDPMEERMARFKALQARAVGGSSHVLL